MSGRAAALAVALAAAGCASSPFAADSGAEARQAALERRLAEVERQTVESRQELERVRRRVAELEAARAAAPAPAPPAAAALGEEAAPMPAPAPPTAIEEHDLTDDEPTSSAAPGAAAPLPPPASEQEAYDRALAELRAGRPGEAETLFAAFLAAHPDSELADNAAFWIGEARLAAGDRAGAIAAYRSAVERYPAGNKVPDALYKLATTWRRLGDEAAARRAAQRLTTEFPDSEPARRMRGERESQ